jgi:D-alanyl-D-alanine carboxypeptidase/D-alanyl-D-alanine-endopeptidase (penicillin-binding protein 4)
MRKHALTFVIILAGFAPPGLAQEPWPPPVLKALRQAGVPTKNVAAVVQELGPRKPSLSVNAFTPMNPASVMKLLTTYAGLELLGPAFRWRTEAYLDGTLREGVLEGNLVLRGTGDPKLNYESFWMLLRALRGKGLREIRGDLVLDRSYFERATGDPGRFDGDPFRPYNVLPDALLVNFKSLRFTFLPEPEAAAVRLYVEPKPPALEVINVLALSGGGCPDGRAFRDLLQPTFQPERPRVLFSGRYPASCGERELNVALLDPNAHIGGLMRQLWGEIGGAWSGTVREGAAAADARPFHVHESAPLDEIVHDLNKHSNNVMARQLYLTLGAWSAGPPAREAKSLAAVKAWLAQKGLRFPELVIENGSGLSRAERISAASLAALLQAAWASPVMPEFMSSLPVAAVNGTMRKRLKGDGVAGNAHVKTGLLADVRSMAGYVRDRNGNRYAVVMIVNHPNAHQAQGALDALLRWTHGG